MSEPQARVLRTPLDDWQICAVRSGAVADPRGLPAEGWTPARAPGTTAAALRAGQAWSLESPPRRFDAEDWWWRTRFAGPSTRESAAVETVLAFEGLATLADVWLNGTPLLASENMFVAHERAVKLGPDNELVIRFRSLDAALGARRPRPRWRAPMIENQQLRWFRTTLLGRTPGWSPPAAAVGPWRPVYLEERHGLVVENARVTGRLQGPAGVVEASCDVRVLDGGDAGTVELVVERGGREHRARLTSAGAGRLTASLTVEAPALWWPHTHGEPACYRTSLELRRGSAVERIDTGPIGFREVTIATDGGAFEVRVGGRPIFCRGACWTPLDAVTLAADRASLAAAIDRVVAAGMNMLRVGGTMVYESDDFYDLCDERGVLVWQDLMFANMDYPDDPAFRESVALEVGQNLSRLARHPSLVLVCGGSEVEQQAAMWGAPREWWSPPLSHELLPALVRQACPGVFYWPSSAHGGAFPHQASVGTTSYYGVGAYLRPLEDARRAEVRFASECLAFANVPGERALPGGPSVRAHHPAWKARTPRDLGAGWDFDDVRDHYVGRLFGVDPTGLRAVDHDRYLALGRVATGEVMAAVFSEWRRARSTCRGGLVWFLRDLWTGAGWGVLDAAGDPKSAYHYLRRTLQPIGLAISDEGNNGLFVHAVSERAAVEADLEVVLYSGGETVVGRGARRLSLGAGEAVELPALALFDGFQDLSYAYRFGPPTCDLVVATLRSGGATLAEAFHFPNGMAFPRERDLGLAVEVAPTPDSLGAVLTVRARRFAQAIAIDVGGFVSDDDYFHLAPGTERRVHLTPVRGGAGPTRGTLQALNGAAAVPISVPRIEAP